MKMPIVTTCEPMRHSRFYSRISYSFGNEDWKVERKALKVKPSDRIICITASGDRPLHLLLDECAEVVSVDLNPLQNHLLDLKMRAMQHFDTDSYVSFLGGRQDNERAAKFQVLQRKLGEQSRTFWTANPKLISRGVLYQGAIELLCQKFAMAMKVLRRHKVRKLFDHDELDEQRHFLDNHWDTSLWRFIVRGIINSPWLHSFLKDPGLSNHGGAIQQGEYIYNRLHGSLRRILARDNPFLSLIFRGYVAPETFPPYLIKSGIGKIRRQLHKLKSHTANMIDFLEQSPPASFDCFSMSDIASYMPAKDFERLLRAIYVAARPGARFSIRQFMSERHIPGDLQGAFQRNPQLEHELEEEEYCFVYRFMAGTIAK